MLCIQRNEIKNRLTFSKSNTEKARVTMRNLLVCRVYCSIDKTFVNEVELRKFNISISYKKNIYNDFVHIRLIITRFLIVIIPIFILK